MSEAITTERSRSPQPSRRLSLAGLPREVRALTLAALASWAILAVLVVALALNADLPGGTFEIQGVPPLPRVLAPAVYLALGLAAAALSVASLGPGWHFGTPSRIALAIVGLAFAGTLLELGHGIDDVRTIDKVELAPAWVAELLVIWGWIGTVAAVIAAVPSRALRSVPRAELWVGTAAALPYALCLLGYLLVVATPLEPQLPIGSFAVAGLGAIVAPVGFFLAALLMWQAAAGARASRDIASGITRTIRYVPQALTVLLAAKLVWLVLAYTGALPGALGSDNEAVDASRGDDVVSWILVSAAAVAAGFWLARRCRLAVDDERVNLAAGIFVGVFLSALGLAALGLLAHGAVQPHLEPGSWLLTAIADFTNWISDRFILVQVLTVYAAGVAGLLIWRRGGPAGVAVFLLLLFGLAFPRAFDITMGWGEPGAVPGRFELASLDAALTVVVAALAWGQWPRDRLVTDTGLLVVLICSTTIAYAGTVIGAFWDTGAFYLALLLPVAYELVYGAQGLNREDEGRSVRVLAFAGAGAGLLAIAAVRIATDFAGPDHPTEAEIGRLLLAPPLAAVLVAGVCSALRPRTEPSAG